MTPHHARPLAAGWRFSPFLVARARVPAPHSSGARARPARLGGGAALALPGATPRRCSLRAACPGEGGVVRSSRLLFDPSTSPSSPVAGGPRVTTAAGTGRRWPSPRRRAAAAVLLALIRLRRQAACSRVRAHGRGLVAPRRLHRGGTKGGDRRASPRGFFCFQHRARSAPRRARPAHPPRGAGSGGAGRRCCRGVARAAIAGVRRQVAAARVRRSPG